MSGPPECIAAASLFVLMIIFRIANMLHYQFDSDEPQHLHVSWGWAHGLVQYRDLFDNHMPLFHIALAPVVALIGERATILYWMRFVLLPMYGIAAWCTYRIGTLLFSRRVGIWAVILVGLYPGYHFTSLEFRTDNLWVPLWLLCITVLVSGALTIPRALVAGLLLGLCFGVSMKSTLFVISLLVAVVTLCLLGRNKIGQSWMHLARCGAAFVTTTLIVPGLIMTFFSVKGLWPEFRYCIFDFNILARAIASEHHFARFLIISSIGFACVVYATRRVIRATDDQSLALRRGFVLLTCASYLAALYSFWELRTPQDYLPFYPLAFVFLTSVTIAASTRIGTANFAVVKTLTDIGLPAFVALLFLSISLITKPFWNDSSREETDLLQSILTITNSDDYVFDCYGETVFRQRCCRPVLETITLKGIRRRIIPDTLVQDCVETNTCVAVMTKGRTHVGNKMFKMFVSQNYIPVVKDFSGQNCPAPKSEVRVAGEFLTPTEPGSSRMDFDVVIPARYEIIAPDGPVTGLLDGTLYEGARFLQRGKHTFVESSGGQNIVLLWAQAADRHFTPFKSGIRRAVASRL